jgi:isopentenyldiphosphate isomerase
MEGEIIDWYDDEGKVVCPLPRRFVHSHNLLHRGIGVLLRRQTNEVYIHKRANSKRTWPGLMDAMIGGIGVSGSSSAETLVRELEEELELCVNAAPEPTIKFIGTTTIYTTQNQCIVDLYTVQLSPGDEERSFGTGDGEIAWGRWIDLHELQAMIKGDESAFVPSGLQCFRFIESNFLG